MKCINCNEEFERFHDDTTVESCPKCFTENPGFKYEITMKDGTFYALQSGMRMGTIIQKVNRHKFIYINRYIIATDEIANIKQAKRYELIEKVKGE